MAANLLFLFFLVAGSGALGYQLAIPDILTNAKSPLDESTAKLVRSLLERGLVFNTPDVCHSLGFFCAHEISSSSDPMVSERSLGAHKLLSAALKSHPGHAESAPPSWVNKRPFGFLGLVNEKQLPSWVNTRPFGFLGLVKEEQPPSWVNKRPFGFLINKEQPSYPFDVRGWAKGEHAKQKLDSLPTKGRAFRFNSAKAGKSILLPPITSLLSNKLIHPHLGDALPFNKENLSQVLRTFNLSANSEMAQSMELALDMGKPTNDDVQLRKSVTATKEMVDFVGGVICKEKEDCHVKSITQSFENKESKMVKVVDVELVSKDSVACHTVPFPYKVYVCHKIKDSPAYKMNMMVEGGKTLSAPFICHWDTSKFHSNHQAFEDLNMKPGEGEICHWLAYETIVWYV